MSSKENLSLNPSASFRDLGDEGIILMAESGQLYSTNQSGSAFIKNVQKGLSFDAAVANILDEFDVEKAVLEKDLNELVDFLIDEAVLIPSKD